MIRNSDIHKNLFKNYNDKCWLENNITKAFLLAFDVLGTDDKLKMINEFNLADNYDDLIKNKEYLNFIIYLQKKPNIINIENLCVKLFAFSPTGKVWDKNIVSLDEIMDDSMRQKNIMKLLKMIEPKIDIIKDNDEETYKQIEKIAEDRFNDIKKNHEERGGSIPDGWIIIKQKEVISNVIILENKKWDLDPYQLMNHIEKSLKKEYNKKYLSFGKYDDIYKFFANLDSVDEYNFKGNRIVLDFLEYLTYLEFEPLDNDYKIIISEENELINNEDIDLNSLTKMYISKRIDNIIKEEFKDFLYKEYDKQLYPSVNDDNVNIFYDIYIDSNKLTIDISSEIGVRYMDYNMKLIEKLKNKQDQTYLGELKNIYKNCIWNRFCKVGQVAGIKYLNIEEYKCIEDYLGDIKLSKGIHRWLSKMELINEFASYKEEFKNFNDGKKGVLEYFRIISRKCYKHDDTIKYDELKKYIVEVTNKHIEGLKIINKIVNE